MLVGNVGFETQEEGRPDLVVRVMRGECEVRDGAGSDIRMLLNMLNIRDEMCWNMGHLADIFVVTARALGLEEKSAKLVEQRRRGEVEHSQWKRQR